jgi:hypothetical protein
MDDLIKLPRKSRWDRVMDAIPARTPGQSALLITFAVFLLREGVEDRDLLSGLLGAALSGLPAITQ